MLSFEWDKEKEKKNLIVSHCYRGKEEIIRIISARKANKREARSYIDRKVN